MLKIIFHVLLENIIHIHSIINKVFSFIKDIFSVNGTHY